MRGTHPQRSFCWRGPRGTPSFTAPPARRASPAPHCAAPSAWDGASLTTVPLLWGDPPSEHPPQGCRTVPPQHPKLVETCSGDVVPLHLVIPSCFRGSHLEVPSFLQAPSGAQTSSRAGSRTSKGSTGRAEGSSCSHAAASPPWAAGSAPRSRGERVVAASRVLLAALFTSVRLSRSPARPAPARQAHARVGRCQHHEGIALPGQMRGDKQRAQAHCQPRSQSQPEPAPEPEGAVRGSTPSRRGEERSKAGSEAAGSEAAGAARPKVTRAGREPCKCRLGTAPAASGLSRARQGDGGEVSAGGGAGLSRPPGEKPGSVCTAFAADPSPHSPAGPHGRSRQRRRRVLGKLRRGHKARSPPLREEAAGKRHQPLR